MVHFKQLALHVYQPDDIALITGLIKQPHYNGRIVRLSRNVNSRWACLNLDRTAFTGKAGQITCRETNLHSYSQWPFILPQGPLLGTSGLTESSLKSGLEKERMERDRQSLLRYVKRYHDKWLPEREEFSGNRSKLIIHRIGNLSIFNVSACHNEGLILDYCFSALDLFGKTQHAVFVPIIEGSNYPEVEYPIENHMLTMLRFLHEKRPDLCHCPLATFDHFKDIQVPKYTPEETTKYFALYKLMEELSTFDDIRDVQIADVISMINTNKHGYPGEGPKFNVDTMSPELTELFGHLHCSKSNIVGVGMSSRLGGCVAKTMRFIDDFSLTLDEQMRGSLGTYSSKIEALLSTKPVIVFLYNGQNHQSVSDEWVAQLSNRLHRGVPLFDS